MSSLHRSGMLQRVFDMKVGLEILEPDGQEILKTIENFPRSQFATRVVWGVWRRLPKIILSRPPVRFNVWLYDRLMSKRLTPSNIFHGCTAACLASLKVAREQGAVTLVESASRHPLHWAQVEDEEAQRFVIDSREGSGKLGLMLLQRREKEFRRCDKIIVPSTVARESYVEFGYGDKTEVVLTGVDVDFFTPTVIEGDQQTFRACYVGRVELSKGVGYLLQAWKKLALPKAELVLAGVVNENMRPLLRDCENSGVVTTGYLLAHSLRNQYQKSDLFVFPSPNEGLAQVLLEAMACGLPVVATDRSGANDCMNNGKEGVIVPARNVDRLAEAILWCYEHRQQAREIGKAARARIDSQFTLEHYNQRVISLYRRLAT